MSLKGKNYLTRLTISNENHIVPMKWVKVVKSGFFWIFEVAFVSRGEFGESGCEGAVSDPNALSGGTF